MKLIINESIKKGFPDLKVLLKIIKDVRVERNSSELEKFKDEVYERIRRSYKLESLKDLSWFRLYRDFFWRVGTDPTKNRPASEALIRRILAGKPIPQINTLVDSYNLASIDTNVALAAFDLHRLNGDLTMRFAYKGEEFLGIGMHTVMILEGGEIVISDSARTVAVYPYRDAEYFKITNKTKDVTLLVCGVPGIGDKTLEEAGQTAIDYVQRFCGGSVQLPGPCS